VIVEYTREYMHDLMQIWLPQSLSAMVWACWVSRSTYPYWHAAKCILYNSQLHHCKCVITLFAHEHSPYYKVNSHKWNRCHAPLISDYSSMSKCSLMHKCNVTLGWYHTCVTKGIYCMELHVGKNKAWCTIFRNDKHLLLASYTILNSQNQ